MEFDWSTLKNFNPDDQPLDEQLLEYIQGVEVRKNFVYLYLLLELNCLIELDLNCCVFDFLCSNCVMDQSVDSASNVELGAVALDTNDESNIPAEVSMQI